MKTTTNNTKKTFAITLIIAVMLAVVSMFSAGAAETAIITTGDYDKLHIQLNGETAFCVERNAVMPEKGIHYTATTFEHPAMLNDVAVAITALNDGTNEFQTASQYAVWQCYEPHLPMDKMANAKYGADVATMVNEILNFVATGEWTANDRQTICTINAVPVVPETTVPTEPVTEPTKPEPTEPETVPTETVIVPTEPETVPTETVTTPTETVEPTEPETETETVEPTEPQTETETTDVIVPENYLPAAKSPVDAPKTGDNTHYIIIMLLIAMAVSIVAIGALAKTKKQ